MIISCLHEGIAVFMEAMWKKKTQRENMSSKT